MSWFAILSFGPGPKQSYFKSKEKAIQVACDFKSTGYGSASAIAVVEFHTLADAKRYQYSDFRDCPNFSVHLNLL
jgi:hypothetical protein